MYSNIHFRASVITCLAVLLTSLSCNFLSFQEEYVSLPPGPAVKPEPGEVVSDQITTPFEEVQVFFNLDYTDQRLGLDGGGDVDTEAITAGSPPLEALRAYRGLTVLGFDVVRSSYNFFPHFLVEVTEADAQAKLDALAQYKTYHDLYYFDPTLLRATMVRHGTLAERKFAEGFDILRIAGKYEVCP